MAIHLVQYNPEIPQNTGNIMRTCVATGVKLHFIKPMGFSLNEKSIKRSGANYGIAVEYEIYENWDDFIEKNKGGKFYLCTRNGKKRYSEIDFSDMTSEHFIILGGETKGIPKEILQTNSNDCYQVPMSENISSLNVSNIGAIIVYEALRQQEFTGLCKKVSLEDSEL